MHATTPARIPHASYDLLLVAIARYALAPLPRDTRAYETARHALTDALGCGLQALGVPECTRLLGPDAPGAVVPHGVRATTVDTIDCVAWTSGPRRKASQFVAGDVVSVGGALRRRFWRAGAGAVSRCEVEVTAVRRVAKAGRRGAAPS